MNFQEWSRCPECKHNGGTHDAACQSGRESTTPVAPPPASPARSHCPDHAGWRSDCDECALHSAAASPEPMPEGWEFVPGEFGGTFLNEGLCKVMSMGRIRQLLATQGLHIVDEASAKVLEACAALDDDDLQWVAPFGITDLIEAELARRGVK